MIELKYLCAGYLGTDVIKNVTANFKRGTLTSILGPNGCGKSTLLKAMLALIPSSAGEVLLDGESVSKLSRAEISRRVSYLSQGKGVPDMTVGKLVLHGRFPHLKYPRIYTEFDRKRADEALEKMGILSLKDKLMSSLSGGMRQKAYVAMALAQDTDFILLDEPATFLDISGSLELMRTLKALAKGGKGVICVMHDIPLALSFSDELVLISDGEVRSHASPDELVASGLIGEVFNTSVEKCDDGAYRYLY